MSARICLMWASVTVVLLQGCQSYAPLPLNQQARLADHLSDLEFGSAPQPLSIDAVSLLAATNNPDLRAVRAERGIAAAQVLQAGILPNPSLGGSYALLLGGPGTSAAFTASLTEDIKSLVTLSARRRSAERGSAAGRRERPVARMANDRQSAASPCGHCRGRPTAPAPGKDRRRA